MWSHFSLQKAWCIPNARQAGLYIYIYIILHEFHGWLKNSPRYEAVAIKYICLILKVQIFCTILQCTCLKQQFLLVVPLSGAIYTVRHKAVCIIWQLAVIPISHSGLFFWPSIPKINFTRVGMRMSLTLVYCLNIQIYLKLLDDILYFNAFPVCISRNRFRPKNVHVLHVVGRPQIIYIVLPL